VKGLLQLSRMIIGSHWYSIAEGMSAMGFIFVLLLTECAALAVCAIVRPDLMCDAQASHCQAFSLGLQAKSAAQISLFSILQATSTTTANNLLRCVVSNSENACLASIQLIFIDMHILHSYMLLNPPSRVNQAL